MRTLNHLLSPKIVVYLYVIKLLSRDKYNFLPI